jgi:hypothetical protein
MLIFGDFDEVRDIPLNTCAIRRLKKLKGGHRSGHLGSDEALRG